MSLSLGQIQNIIHTEYAKLVACFGLSPIPCDVYEVNRGPGETTAHGTDTRNATPGYTPSHLVLPQDPENLVNCTATQLPFPPKAWDPHSDEWPVWRIELWHEVVHQYQHQILNNWNPQDGDEGHAKGWPDALDAVAKQFGISRERLGGVL